MFKYVAAGARAQRLWVLAALAASGAMAHAGDEPAARWQVGAFSGAVVDSGSTTEIALRCSGSGPCAVELKMASGPSAGSVDRLSTGQSRPMSADIPNSELQGARAAVQDAPGLYGDARYGGLLSSLRPHLESNARLSSCLDISEDSTGSMGLCVVSSDPIASKSLILLLPTMNPSCRSQPFCAYYLVPMARVSSGR